MIITTARDYWTVMRRFNHNRANPAMPGVAMRDLRKIGASTASAAVKRRVNAFLPPVTPGDGPDGSGPRIA